MTQKEIADIIKAGYQDGLTQSELADVLNETNVPCPVGTGGPWDRIKVGVMARKYGMRLRRGRKRRSSKNTSSKKTIPAKQAAPKQSIDHNELLVLTANALAEKLAKEFAHKFLS